MGAMAGLLTCPRPFRAFSERLAPMACRGGRFVGGTYSSGYCSGLSPDSLDHHSANLVIIFQSANVAAQFFGFFQSPIITPFNYSLVEWVCMTSESAYPTRRDMPLAKGMSLRGYVVRSRGVSGGSLWWRGNLGGGSRCRGWWRGLRGGRRASSIRPGRWRRRPHWRGCRL